MNFRKSLVMFCLSVGDNWTFGRCSREFWLKVIINIWVLLKELLSLRLVLNLWPSSLYFLRTRVSSLCHHIHFSPKPVSLFSLSSLPPCLWIKCNSQLLLQSLLWLPADLFPFLIAMDSPSGTVYPKLDGFFYKLSWSWCFVTTIEM